MPNYILEVPDVHHAITRPIVKYMADFIIRNFGLEHYGCQIIINGLNEAIPISQSTLGNEKEQLRIDSDARIEVEFEEEVLNPVSIAILREEHKPVIHDSQLHVQLKPFYTEVQLTLKFKFIAPDQSSATTWQTRAELQAYRQMNKFLTQVDYHYTIPEPFIKQLWVIHALRERSPMALDESFGSWIRRVSARRMTTISNLAGNGKTLAVPELQTRIHGWFDFDYQPQKVEKHNQASAWATQFNVTMHYDRVDAVVMNYPLMVYNQMIPAEFRDEEPVEKNYYMPDSERSMSMRGISLFEMTTNSETWYSSQTTGIAIPHFDDWMPDHIESFHTNTTHILMQFDLDDPKYIIDFEDDNSLGDYRMHYYIKDYLRDLSDRLFVPFTPLFLVSMQRWNDSPVIRDLTMGRDLRVMSKHVIDARPMYHLVINTLYDLSMMSKEGRDILSRHPKVVEHWMQWRYINDWYRIPIPFNPDGTIDIDRLIQILDDMSLWNWGKDVSPTNPARWSELDRLNDLMGKNPRSGWRYGEYRGKIATNLVNSFSIIAMRKGELNHAHS